MAQACLIFDLDGTLSDPAVGILRSINYALTSFGYSEISESEVAAYIGPPIDLTFRKLTQSTSAEHVLALVAKYRNRYADIGYSENRLYPGIIEALRLLRARGLSLGVCTSKRVDVGEKVLSMFQLREYFDFVSGGEVGVTKSDQLYSLLTQGIVGKDSLMIGDRAVDIKAAKHNLLRSAGVLWGHGSQAELAGAGADYLLSRPADLGTIFRAV